MEKRWVVRDKPDKEHVWDLCRKINVNPVLGSVLVQRGITNYDHARDFFRPQLSKLHDPFLMKDMDKAVNRLTEAISDGDKILIYGDYDVDGTTSVALFIRFLRKFYDNLEFYIPDRYSEGYGVSNKAMDWAKENEIGLIISLDCGIKAHDPIRRARGLGIDFIVCDHHVPSQELPPATAILDPKRKDCPYPFKDLSGCGVGFKLLTAFSIQNGLNLNALYDELDLLVVSIAADIVPIKEENRILAYYGLEQLNMSPSVGLKALIGESGLKQDINITNIVFGIAPRINAAGRIGHARLAVRLLISEDIAEAEKLASKLNTQNLERREHDARVLDEILETIEADDALQKRKTTVLFGEDWHKGVIGIAASRSIEKYYRPTIILTKSNDKATGSARSVPGFNIYDAISECSEFLEQYGGHAHAAGLTLSLENIESFSEKFENVVDKSISEELLLPKINIDHRLDLDKISMKFFTIIRQMEPFGPGNMNPVFFAEDCVCSNPPTIVGDNHLKMYVKQKQGKKAFEAIGFNLGEYYELIIAKEHFGMAFSIGLNEFNGERFLQLVVKDIKFDSLNVKV